MLLKFKSYKTKLKLKSSLRGLLFYYKQLLFLFNILFDFEKTSFILVNNCMSYSMLKAILALDAFENSSAEIRYFKFNINIYKYLISKNFFKFLKLDNIYILSNFNYIFKIPNKFTITVPFLQNIINLSNNSMQFFYIKLYFYNNLISLTYYKDFLDKIVVKDLHYKNIRLFIFSSMLLLRLLHHKIAIKNVTNNLSIS